MLIDGKAGLQPIEIRAKAGSKLSFDGSSSYDPDGDSLRFDWWFQEFPDGGELPAIDGPQASKVSFIVPEDAAGAELHLVCEVHDDGAFTLPAYRRIIISVE